MTTKQFIPLARHEIDEEDIRAVSDALKSPQITRGEYVKKFEDDLAAYVDVPYAVAFNSGSSALNAAAYALDIGHGDRVISTPNTFVSTVGSTVERGANPIFVDIDPKTGLWDNDLALVNLETDHTRGKDILTPVHFAGATVDVEYLERQLKKVDSYIIEDAAQALGAKYADGTKVGSCHNSSMTIFSFHPSKTITTGEGGIVTTRSEELYERLLVARDNGIDRNNFAFPGFYEVLDFTCNYHMTAMQAALGSSQLKKVDQFVAKRRELVAYYRKKLKGFSKVIPLSAGQDHRSAHHLFVVFLNIEKHSRAHVMEMLNEKGIGSQVHYIPLYRHPVFTDLMGDVTQYFPNTEEYYSHALSLPLYTQLTFEEIDYIVDSLKEILR